MSDSSIGVTVVPEDIGQKPVDYEIVPTGSGSVYRQRVSVIDASANRDAFGKMRVSQTFQRFNAQHQYGTRHTQFFESLTGTGAITERMDESSLRLAVTTTGDKAQNRGRRIYYRAGLSMNVMMTFNLRPTAAGVIKRVGFYDDDDGIFLKHTSAGASFVIRTSTSGTPSDAREVAQASWNVDKLDGTGASGVTIDWTKTQILTIDYQWLGVGRVRCGFNIDGQTIIAHNFDNANSQTIVYMQTPSLPCTYDLESTGGASDMDMICASVFVEMGAGTEIGHKHSISNGNTPVTIDASAWTPLLSIRPAALFKTRTNKGMMEPIGFDLIVVGAKPIVFRVLEDAVLTTPTWTAHPDAVGAEPDSMVEYDVASTSLTNGHIREAGYVVAGSKGGQASVPAAGYRMQRINGHVDTLTLVALGIGGSSSALASISWREYL